MKIVPLADVSAAPIWGLSIRPSSVASSTSAVGRIAYDAKLDTRWVVMVLYRRKDARVDAEIVLYIRHAGCVEGGTLGVTELGV